MTEDRQTNPNGDSDPSPKGLGLPHDANDLPTVTTHVDGNQIKQFATQIKSAEHQIGEHILTALQDPETVAVLTAVVVGLDGTQSIVSAALEPEIRKLEVDVVDGFVRDRVEALLLPDVREAAAPDPI